MGERMKALLSQATGGVFATTGAFLTIWRGGLSAERAAQLARFERQGARIGLTVRMPADRYVIDIFILDGGGDMHLLETVEQYGAVPSVN